MHFLIVKNAYTERNTLSPIPPLPVALSGIRTWIVRVEVDPADHLTTTTTANLCSFYFVAKLRR